MLITLFIMSNSFVLLARSIIDSQVFANDKMLKVWIWCLCKANHKGRFASLKIGKGYTEVEVKRGQFIFGRSKAEEEIFYDGSTIYKIMQKLQKLEMIMIESNNQYSIITICKYDEYQSEKAYKVTTKEQPSNNQVTTKGQPSNTNNNVNNVNNDNKEINIDEPVLSDEEKEIWASYADWFKEQDFKIVPRIKEQLAAKQLFKLLDVYDSDDIKDTLMSMENYPRAKTYTSVYLTLNAWLKKSVKI